MTARADFFIYCVLLGAPGDFCSFEKLGDAFQGLFAPPARGRFGKRASWIFPSKSRIPRVDAVLTYLIECVRIIQTEYVVEWANTWHPQ